VGQEKKFKHNRSSDPRVKSYQRKNRGLSRKRKEIPKSQSSSTTRSKHPESVTPKREGGGRGNVNNQLYQGGGGIREYLECFKERKKKKILQKLFLPSALSKGGRRRKNKTNCELDSKTKRSSIFWGRRNQKSLLGLLLPYRDGDKKTSAG